MSFQLPSSPRTTFARKSGTGFTLIETLVAVSLLSIAIVAPMLLTVQSLSSAAYARDQITASYLAQEGVEQVRQLRDDNILKISEGLGGNIFDGIPSFTQPFTVDAHTGTMSTCAGTCPLLETDGQLYGYSAGWTNTIFTRAVNACYLQATLGACNGTPTDEVQITVTVSWQTGSFTKRSFSITEDLYRWVQDGSGV